jgi:peptidoglycan/LPS O-acetylase OafA/YrhL
MPKIMNKNNFDGVRISLALIVFFSHISALTQADEFKFFEDIFDSNFAVKGFFAISGFLVTQSYLSSRSNLEYFNKRFFRIFPAYVTVIVLCLSIGFLVTSLGAFDFLMSPQTLKYIFANLTFLNFIQPTLPEVFETNPIQALNGSLWTIKVEIMLYVCIPFLIYFFRRIESTYVIFIIFFSSIFWVYFFTVLYEGSKGEQLARQFPGQLSYFALGAYLAVNEKIKNNITLIAFIGLIALFITNNSLLRLIIDPIAYSAIVLYLSLAACKSLNIGRYGDVSFGIYLYHFPIIQLFIF